MKEKDFNDFLNRANKNLIGHIFKFIGEDSIQIGDYKSIICLNCDYEALVVKKNNKKYLEFVRHYTSNEVINELTIPTSNLSTELIEGYKDKYEYNDEFGFETKKTAIIFPYLDFDQIISKLELVLPKEVVKKSFSKYEEMTK